MMTGLILLTVSFGAQAATLEEGGSYASGSVVEVSKYDVHFTIPEGWQARGLSDQAIELSPGTEGVVEEIRFYPDQDVFDFDHTMQRNPLLMQNNRMYIKAAGYNERVTSSGVSYTLQGMKNGQPLSGLYAIRSLPYLDMSFTKMLVAPSYAWNAPRDQRSIALLQRVNNIDHALIDQAEERKAALEAKRARERASSSSSSDGSSGNIGTTSSGQEFFAAPGISGCPGC